MSACFVHLAFINTSFPHRYLDSDDIDVMLKMDSVTLDEAMKISYQVVLLAISVVSVLVSVSRFPIS